MRHLRKTITRMAFAVPLLVLAAAPVQADIANVGGGVVAGTLNFTQGGVPTVGLGCVATTWSFNANAAAIVIDLVNDAAQGVANVSASGSSPCANSVGESGAISALTAKIFPTGTPLGFNVGSTFTCGPAVLPGSGYQRVGTHVHIDVRDTCQINGVTPLVEFIAEGEFVPTTAPNTNNEFTSAAFAAGFAVAPPF
jgi:hypothetical protein